MDRDFLEDLSNNNGTNVITGTEIVINHETASITAFIRSHVRFIIIVYFLNEKISLFFFQFPLFFFTIKLKINVSP